MGSAASDFFDAPLGGIAKTTERTLTGVGSSNWANVRVGQSHLHPSENFTGKAPGDLIIGLGARQLRCGPRQ